MIDQEQMNVVTYRRQTTIIGEEAFQIFSDDFITGPLIVKNAVPGMWYYISGNSGELNIYYV